ncbi:MULTISPECIES: ABC transporter ATP-binding protein [Aeromicrobium]|nr:MULTISPECIES: ABC transporter ATP-binding protein [Aeromicrobium]
MTMTQADRDVVLEIRGATRWYPDGDLTIRAVDGIDLTVSVGEFVAVMGPSGSGKSTLLRLAGGLDLPDDGTVVVDGVDLASCSAAALAGVRRRSAGYVFQELNLIRTLSLTENVALPLELDGMSFKASMAAARAALAELDLIDAERRRPDQVSGGERQRAAIARALVGERRLILADEPTGSLDSTTGEDIMKRLRERVDAGAGAVMVTHDPRHAAWADTVVFLRDGKIVDRSTAGGGAA